MARLRSLESYGKKHSCRVCAFRSRSISKMAVHSHTEDTDVVEHQQCSGASLFSTSYAHAMQFNAEQGQGLFGGAPSSENSQSSPRAGSIDELAAHPESPDGIDRAHHVMELIEHIITSCTPVAEAHALLGIIRKAGTVPGKSMPPYLKVLRA